MGNSPNTTIISFSVFFILWVGPLGDPKNSERYDQAKLDTMGVCASCDDSAAKSYSSISSSELTDVSTAGKKQAPSLVTRDSLMDIAYDHELDDEESSAIRKIQKSLRRTKALDKANAENHWRFFAQVDTLEENETLQLTDFMRNLVKLVPGVKEIQDEDELRSSAGGQAHIVLDDIIVEDDIHKQEREDTEREIGKLKVDPNSKFVMKKGPITSELPNSLKELFRPPNIGHIESESLVKLLRKVYKTFKAMSNINEITVPKHGRITVVGDIHGQVEDLLLILDEILDGSMDAEGINLFLNIIRKEMKNKNIFMISHRDNIDSKFDKIVEFQKKGHFTQKCEITK